MTSPGKLGANRDLPMDGARHALLLFFDLLILSVTC
jgi:hypothetical protein